MKQKFIPKGSLIAAVDVGSTKTVCFIGRVIDENGGYEVLGVGNSVSAGMKNGMMVDLDAAEGVIRKTVHAAENMAADSTKGYPLREVVVNVPGTHCRSFGRTIDIQIGGHEVTKNDIRTALMQAQDSITQDGGMDDSQILAHAIRVGCRIDGHGGIKDALGMTGQNLSMDIHLVTADQATIKNITKCTDRSHLDIAAFCSASYAAGLATLVEDEKDLGCTVIDIGGGTTSFAVFHGGAMIYSDALSVGGQHVTNDIAAGLTTSLADAERIKILYGSATQTQLDDAELIDVPRVGEEERREPNHIPRSMLIGIIRPRLEEIFELVRARLHDTGLGAVIGRRVVLTGGGSQMPGMKDLAGNVLDKQVRLGRPINVTGLPDAVSGPAFSGASGLLTYIAQHGADIPGALGETSHAGSMWHRAKMWLKENW